MHERPLDRRWPSQALAWVFFTLAALPFRSAAQPVAPPLPERRVEEGVLISTALPNVRIRVDEAFAYLGSFAFTLRGIAYGERFVFADTSGNRVERLFIAQFEGFLPDNTHTYNYNFSEAETIAGFRFRQNTWAYSNTEAERESPDAEGALTARFIRSRGLNLEDELMMSRFVMVPDAERRHEMILFYLENASGTGHPIASFYDASDNPAPHWREISAGLTDRSRESFSIIDP
jgi:hypothetical protein